MKHACTWRSIALASLLSISIGGCATWSLRLVPGSPSEPWRPAGALGRQAVAAPGARRAFAIPVDPDLPWPVQRPVVDGAHVYTLAELIDFAECAHPDTRIAWEKARQAALTAGIALAEYLPVLSASVIGGYHRTWFPLPIAINDKAYFSVDTFALAPSLGVKWLLFDFGGRVALVESARQLSAAGNATFTGAHQKVILDVAKAFFNLNAAQAQVAVAREALEHAKKTAEAVEARRNRGVATVVEETHARREVVQAEYNLAQASALEANAHASLLEAMGADPLAHIRVEPNTSHPLPSSLGDDVERYVRAALKQRPDVLAALSRVRAADANVVLAKSTFLPKLGFAGAIGAEILGVSIEGSRFREQTLPTGSALFQLDWALWDSGVRLAQVKIAQSQRAEAEYALARVQDSAIRQVIAAYREVATGLQRHHAAEALAQAADVAEDAAAEAYKNGVGTYTEYITAQTARVQAHSVREASYAEVLTAAAALAFGTGELTSADALAAHAASAR
jgi:outer membrane protein TolC